MNLYIDLWIYNTYECPSILCASSVLYSEISNISEFEIALCLTDKTTCRNVYNNLLTQIQISPCSMFLYVHCILITLYLNIAYSYLGPSQKKRKNGNEKKKKYCIMKREENNKKEEGKITANNCILQQKGSKINQYLPTFRLHKDYYMFCMREI